MSENFEDPALRIKESNELLPNKKSSSGEKNTLKIASDAKMTSSFQKKKKSVPLYQSDVVHMEGSLNFKNEDFHEKHVQGEDDAKTNEIDYSTLLKFPQSVVLEAIEYAKRKRKEEKDKETEHEYIPLKCVPPWAKTYGTEALDVCSTVGTQYEIPSYLRLAEEQEVEKVDWDEEFDENEEGDEDLVGEALTIADKKRSSTRKGTLDKIDAMYEEKKSSSGEEGDEESDEESVKGSSKKKRSIKRGSKGESSDEDIRSDISSKTAVSVKTDVGLQIAPHMRQFGMQTGRDSLMEANLLDKVPSFTIDSMSEALRKMSIDDAALQELLQGLTSEERLLFLTSLEGKTESEIELEIQLKKQSWGYRSHLSSEEIGEGFEFEEGGKLGEEYEVEVGEAAEAFVGEGWDEEMLQGKKVRKAREPGKQTEYLKEHLGGILPKILAEIAWKRPQDPVHYLAHRLYFERRQKHVLEQVQCMKNVITHGKEERPEFQDQIPIKTFGYFHKEEVEPLPIEYDPFIIEDEEEEEGEEEEEEEPGETVI